MSEDKKLNEVIYTLERCCDVQSECIDHVYVCPVCPYAVNVDEHGGLPCESLAPLMWDALVLLKEQQPRVMTVEEILRHDGAVFFEDRNKGEWAVFSSWGYKRRSNWMTFAFGSNCGHITGFNIDVYGKFWRCWTAKPTDEQRERVKWDE